LLVAKKQGKDPFHAPFAKLKERAAARRPEQAAPAPPALAPPPPPPREPSEDELWANATAGVAPLERGPGRVEPPPPAPAPAREATWHPDLDALRALEALVSGDAPFDLSDSDEFIEGRVPGLDAGIVRRLRRGEFAVQGHIDLHGMTREEAKLAVDAFLKSARSAGKRCVLLVHGRGIHSKDQVPILKDALKHWLATARFGRHVLAFATARPEDGGAGAIYVLLRRAGRCWS
jgi:DNA-nicking Smr family endonuclease